MVEVIGSLAISAVVMIGAANLTNQAVNDSKALVAAQYMQYISNAASAYITDNTAAIQAVATTTVPAMIPVSALRSTGYLDSTFSSVNGYGQTACIVVLQSSTTNLEAIVVTTGGDVMSDIDLSTTANAIGASGGAIYSASPTAATTDILGSGGSYQFTRGNFENAARDCSSAAGVGGVDLLPGHPVVALWFNQSAYSSGMLYRSAVSGRPELNRMSTTLDMSGNAISNASSVQISGVNVSDAVCTAAQLGVISRNSTGNVLMCNGAQKWKTQGSAFWTDPVATSTALPACDATSKWQTKIVQTPMIGSGPRAYTCNGTSWFALSVQDNGDMAIPGKIVGSGSNGSYGATTVQGDKNGWGGIRFQQSDGTSQGTLMMHPNYSGFYNAAENSWRYYVDNAGNSYQPGSASIVGTVTGGNLTTANLTTTGTAQFNTVVLENTACASNGLVARDAVGLLLSCQSSVWKKATGSVTGLQVYICPRYCVRWGPAPFISTQNWCNNNYDSGQQACSPIGKLLL